MDSNNKEGQKTGGQYVDMPHGSSSEGRGQTSSGKGKHVPDAATRNRRSDKTKA